MKNIDVYYESLKQVYEQIINWPLPKPSRQKKVIDAFSKFSLTLLLLSLAPILPSLFVIIGGYFGLSLFSITLKNLTIINFIIIWVIASAISYGIFLLIQWIDKKVGVIPGVNSKPPQSLSSEQLSFIAAYESYKELKIFFVSHIEQHIDKSLIALYQILEGYPEYDYRKFGHLNTTVLWKRRYAEILLMRKHADFKDQVQEASSFLRTFEKYAWFELGPTTKSTLQALISFSQKIPYRLEEKQDLPRVLSVLENLSRFIYAYLPEHKTYMEAQALQELHSEGAKCLGKFVQEINDLTTFTRPEKQEEGKHRIRSTLTDKIKAGFNENIFFRFSVWFLLILGLTSGTVALINLRLTLSPDTMATVIIGTSVASAAALASFLPKKSK